MDICVTDADGLPEQAYLSVRVGDVRRQVQFKPGSRFHFDADAPRKYFELDVFEKVGSTKVSLMDLNSAGDNGEKQGNVDVIRKDGTQARMSLKVAVSENMKGTSKPPSAEGAKRANKQQLAAKAKNYLDGHGVQKLLQSMVHLMLEEQPADPLSFMKTFFHDKAASRGEPKPPPPSTEKPKAQLSPQPTPAPPTQRAAPAAEQRPAPPAPPAAGATQKASLPAPESPLPNWAETPGLGDGDVPGFNADGSESLPDLSGHFSVVALVLKDNPDMYDQMRTLRTKCGTAVARCIKTGIDNKGHPMVRALGLVACDEFCYEVFNRLFEPVISRWHGVYKPHRLHPTDMSPSKITRSRIDTSGGHVVSTFVSMARNLSGLRMLPACSREERREVERLAARCFLLRFGDDLGGRYFPLRGSSSFLPMPTGMSTEDAEDLSHEGLLFDEPDSMVFLSSGFGRQWPDARGVFKSHEPGLSAAVNEMDHIKLTSRRSDGDLAQAFGRLVRAEREMAGFVRDAGFAFAHSGHLGFLTACPSQLGTAMSAGAVLRLPLLSSDTKFQDFIKAIGLVARVHVGEDIERTDSSLWHVTGSDRLGSSEVDQINAVIEGCRTLVELEMRLEQGEEINIIDRMSAPTAAPAPKPAPASTQRGKLPALDEVDNQAENEEFGEEEDEEEYDEGFPTDECPVELPDLSEHHSLMADIFKEDPSLYSRLRGARTKCGVNLAMCIKTGVDNPGHPMVKSLGLVAGDAESYDVFRELFEPIISTKHSLQASSLRHVVDTNPNNVSVAKIDPSTEAVAGLRLQASRSIQGFRMAPACSLEERREVERLIVEALECLGPGQAGEYYSLAGSESDVARPWGMDEAEEQKLRKAGVLFEEPDSDIKQCAGYGRDWPDARGVWLSNDGRLSAWINEEEHLRMVITDPGQDLRGAFTRLCSVLGTIESGLLANGFSFARSEKLGYLTSSPGTLGSCLTTTVTLRLPHLAPQPEFRALCQELGVRPHPAHRLHMTMRDATACGVYDISNCRVLGISEVEQVNKVLRACSFFVDLNKRLEAGESVQFKTELEALGAAA